MAKINSKTDLMLSGGSNYVQTGSTEEKKRKGKETSEFKRR